MTPYLVASLWWALLGLSIVLTAIALARESWRLALLAVLCSAAFAVAALASIGLLILPLPFVQLLLAFLLFRRRRSSRVSG